MRTKRAGVGRSALSAMAVVALLAGSAAAGDEEPLHFVDGAGQTVALQPDERTRAVVLHFWATWCPTCVEEMAGLDRAARACAGQPVVVAAVNVAEKPEVVERFFARQGIALRSLRDPKGERWRELTGGRGLPYNLVWTANERRGELKANDEATWQATLERLGCRADESPPPSAP